ncbi:hypothetical protein O3597_26920 [Verrucosispora sp. WMMA2044]|uniref:hypothetical protein n=1 Tax=Verrucosispora sp. WMMA2044 TaxID=3016419 RepID=UPI00248B6414|nr:hypothetical protein [Verrucosispora sp. WMMA2044]WBB48664.1 hypothetical protein O3597_26920 [Verrucosispora sp. WMMA2044]
MSLDGWLACIECRMCLALGKPIRPDGDEIRYFQVGYVANSAQPDLTRALWKFLADHAGHPLRVLVTGQPGYDDLEHFIEIGGDAAPDIPFEEYLRDFPG